ncbi:MAG: hypothetical protein J0I19_01490 [Alphaproteobacteria bacterium]|nr:hypothetical protein [Alphaproteobacteria bacterium]
MMKIVFAGAFALSFAIAPLSAQTLAGAAEIPLSGHISTDMASRLHAALQDGKPHTVRINSSGGEDAPALAIAADIARTRSALVVDGICAGPCANYLLMAAARRTVQPSALVIFTASASSRLAMVPQARRKEVSGLYESSARQERQLLQDRHVSAALLLEPQLGLGTSCYSLTSRDTAGKAYINYQAQFVGWTPPRAWLARAGIPISGFWPDTEAQFQTALQKAIPGGARGGVIYAAAKSPGAETALLRRLGAMPECDSGLPKKK